MRGNISAGLFFSMLLLASSCRYTSIEELTKDDCDTCQTVICDTMFVLSYLNDIRPIISGNCDKCHSTSNAPIYGNGNVLGTYTGLADYAGNGTLLCVINHDLDCPPMPDDDPKLSDCLISRIDAWVRQGHPNN